MIAWAASQDSRDRDAHRHENHVRLKPSSNSTRHLELLDAKSAFVQRAQQEAQEEGYLEAQQEAQQHNSLLSHPPSLPPPRELSQQHHKTPSGQLPSTGHHPLLSQRHHKTPSGQLPSTGHHSLLSQRHHKTPSGHLPSTGQHSLPSQKTRQDPQRASAVNQLLLFAVTKDAPLFAVAEDATSSRKDVTIPQAGHTAVNRSPLSASPTLSVTE